MQINEPNMVVNQIKSVTDKVGFCDFWTNAIANNDGMGWEEGGEYFFAYITCCPYKYRDIAEVVVQTGEDVPENFISELEGLVGYGNVRIAGLNGQKTPEGWKSQRRIMERK